MESAGCGLLCRNRKLIEDISVALIIKALMLRWHFAEHDSPLALLALKVCSPLHGDEGWGRSEGGYGDEREIERESGDCAYTREIECLRVRET